ncbi:branched-chain amino acid ABC transporter ATP-binding protein/permease [Streptomyces neyagawaensis]|uniref:branched-chain amino acid ABC transporter ATP-binding protein/permease n=1 Tax=Streptomyces neyagawaensis TaxID=42238 RepID=UPI0007C75E16|nr:ATP-binding cassette domain-containing protein [Streptomyces neyagawaensis]MCL6737472.1 ATP-binding cassette domain-containing protein [Streptomyces neyagawaensis]MDE1688243.1 ATP-binding cassette domain-containing protein [Streptomyces neyagawaensis]
MKPVDPRIMLAGTVMLLAVAGAAFGLSSYWVFLATSAVLSALIALSVGVVHGRAGMVALCPLAFAGIGAWTVGWLNVHTGLPFLVMALCGALAAVPVGVAIGLPALRLRGVNLAVATLAFGGALAVVVFDKGFPGAAERSQVSRPSLFASEPGYFLLSAAVLAAVAVALAAVSRRSTGARWTAVRDSERATAALGYSVTATKLLAFAVSAFIAGLGGALMAGQLGVLSGVGFQPLASMVAFTAAVAFGSAYLEGALLAGLATTFVPEVLRQLGLPQDIAPGLFALAALQALAGGSEGVAGKLRAGLAARQKSGRPFGPDDSGVAPGPRNGTSGPDDTHAAPAAERGSRSTAHGTPEPETSAAALRVAGVSVAYGAVKAIEGVDLTITQGTVHGLIGPNGAGKSTLIDVLSGFVAPVAGQVVLNGVSLDGVPPHRRARHGIRRSFQQGRVNPELTIGQYLVLSSRGHADRQLVLDLLDAFDCPSPATKVASIDVGTRRLVEVAATMASRPSVVLLDEPAAGLSAQESARLGIGIAAIPERFGCAVLLVEHDIELVATCCDEVTALDFGRVIANGTPAAVLADPAVTRAYLGTGGQPSSGPSGDLDKAVIS